LSGADVLSDGYFWVFNIRLRSAFCMLPFLKPLFCRQKSGLSAELTLILITYHMFLLS